MGTDAQEADLPTAPDLEILVEAIGRDEVAPWESARSFKNKCFPHASLGQTVELGATVSSK